MMIGYKLVDISQNNKDTLEILHNQSQATLILQKNIIGPLYNLRELSQSLVMAPNKKIRDSIEEELQIVLEQLDKEFLRFKTQNNAIYMMWIHYKSLIQTSKEYLNSDFEEGAYLITTTSSKEQFKHLLDALLSIQSDALNKSTLSYNEAVKNAKELILKISFSIFFILLFSLFAGSLVTNNIINSIYTVQEGLKDFFDYLNHKSEKASNIELICNDEFNTMAKKINENVQTIQDNIEKDEALIKDATKVLENIKSGNLGDRLTKITNNVTLNEFQIMINTMIDNLEYKIQEEIDKRLEQEQILIQQSKLASMGEIIGNIAHQWRQPLAQIVAIFMNIKVTSDFNKITPEYLNSKIEEANSLTHYMSQTIDDFQNFFKPQSQKELFSIEKACREALFIIESSLKYHEIKVEFILLDELKTVGYKNEYSQVILNVLNNAKNILLEREIKNPYINIMIKEGENFAIVKIEDNGGGIDKDILEKIFEPYFTTRHKTQGTGIGLYMSKNIIENNMHGYINVKNTDVGACFTIKVLRHTPA